MGGVEDVLFPICQFRKKLAVLLFELTNDIIITKKLEETEKFLPGPSGGFI